MKKTAFFSLVFAVSAILSAQIPDSVNVIRLTGSTGDLQVRQITVKNDGTAEYIPLNGAGKITVPAGKYEYIRIAKPDEISAVDQLLLSGKEPAKAADLFRKFAESYGRTGWWLYCSAREAEALSQSGQIQEAVKKLKQIRQTPVKYEIFRKDQLLCDRILIELLIRSRSLPEAEKMTEQMMNSADSETACLGFLLRGDICKAKKDPAAARLYYIQASVLFPKSTFHPEALFKIAELLFLAKDPRFSQYETLMKKRYPKSPFTKKLGELKR